MAELTGRKVLAITVGAFGIIIAVNLVMAWKAISTFPGLEVKNSYVASQGFDARRKAQERLGWTMQAGYDQAQGQLSLVFTGRGGVPVTVDSLKVLVGRTTEAAQDLWPEFRREGGVYLAPAALAPGKWMMKVEAMSPDGTLFEQRVEVVVRG